MRPFTRDGALAFALTLAIRVSGTCGALAGCDDPRAPIDPDGRGRRDLAREEATARARLRDVQLATLVAATAGVTVREAPSVLESWLGASPLGRTLLARWPRTGAGALDLDRAPLTAREVRAALDHASRSTCGELLVLLRGGGPPSVRVRLPLPATSRACRASRAPGARPTSAALEGPAVFDALDEAIAAGRALDTTASTP